MPPLDKSGFQAPSAKIRVGPISGQKSPYPLPQRFPHIVPIGPAAFDGSVPDKLPFAGSIDQANSIAPSGNPILGRQWRFTTKVSFINPLQTGTLTNNQTTTLAATGFSLSLGLNEAFRIRRYISFLTDVLNTAFIVVFARGIEISNINDIPNSPSGDIPPNTAFIKSTMQLFNDGANTAIANSGAIPGYNLTPSFNNGDAVYDENTWIEFDDFADFFFKSARGLVDIPIQIKGKWIVKNTDGAASHTYNIRDAISFEKYELVT